MILEDVLLVLKEYAEESEWKRTFSRNNSLVTLGRIMESENRDIIIITEKDEIAALSIVSCYYDFVEEKYGSVDIFYVRKKFRKKAFGRLLAAKTVNWFKLKECDKIFTSAMGKIGKDQEFINLLKKFGFKEFAVTMLRE